MDYQIFANWVAHVIFEVVYRAGSTLQNMV